MTALAAFAPSGRTEYPTPQPLYDTLHAEFGFGLDAAASRENAKCARFFTKEDDALQQSWLVKHKYNAENVWCNPPYGRGVTERWLDKGWRESEEHEVDVVMLVPAAVGSRWWVPLIVHRAAEIRFISGRLRFGDTNASATFDSAVVIYEPPPFRKGPVSWIGTDGRLLACF